jgi:hypothetical protein
LTVIIEEEDEGKYSEKDIIAHLRRENDEAMRALDEDGNTANEAKWYESDKDMIEFSKKYPEVRFILNQIGQGDGGDEDDEDDDGSIEFDNIFQNGVMD